MKKTSWSRWFSIRLQVLAVLLAAHVMSGTAEPPSEGLGSGRSEVTRDFRMQRVGADKRAEGPPPDYRAETVEYLAKGDAGDEMTTLLFYGGAEARAALYAADQTAKQTVLMERQTAALEIIAARLTEMVFGRP